MNQIKMSQSKMISRGLKSKENVSQPQKGMNPTEKDAAMKNQRVVVEDMTVIVEALAIEDSTVGDITQTLKEENGKNTGEETNTLAEGHTHRNTGEEITMMTTSRGQGLQPIQDTKFTPRIAQIAGGQIETRPDDHAMTDKGITHPMTMKDTGIVKARIAIERLPMKKPFQDTEMMNT